MSDLNLNNEYEELKNEILREMTDCINKDILVKNAVWEKYLSSKRSDEIRTKIKTELSLVYCESQSKAKGYSTYTKTGDYFKNHSYEAFFNRSPKNEMHEDLTFFMDVTLPEIRKRDLKKYNSESEEYRNQFYNDSEFLRMSDFDLMKHLFKTEIIDRIINTGEFDLELGLSTGSNSIGSSKENITTSDYTNDNLVKDRMGSLLSYLNLLNDDGELIPRCSGELIGITKAVAEFPEYLALPEGDTAVTSYFEKFGYSGGRIRLSNYDFNDKAKKSFKKAVAFLNTEKVRSMSSN